MLQGGPQRLVPLVEDLRVHPVDVPDHEGHGEEDEEHEPTDDALLHRRLRRHLGLRHVVPLELRHHPEGAARDEERQAQERAVHREVTPGGDVLVEVVHRRGLEAGGAAGHQPNGVVRLRHAHVGGDHVEEEDAGQQEERDHLEELVEVVELRQRHALPHAEHVVHRVLDHEPGDDAQRGEGGQPVVEHVVLEEARVVGDLHGVAVGEAGAGLHDLLHAAQLAARAAAHGRLLVHPLVHRGGGGALRPEEPCDGVQERRGAEL
mmetsp:Transcript_86557/g.222965  ORF Transcript_86557/g.222965 Transcript_86557/m.222965 type:complete len:263 (-) Transcript_86557:16-804(-)